MVNMNKKPISVQFKFFEDLRNLTAPTEPRLSIVHTVPIPAQSQRKLRKAVRRHRVPMEAALMVVAIGLAVCGCLFLTVLFR
jgi:hypothetical protein